MKYDYKLFSDIFAKSVTVWDNEYSGWIFSANHPKTGMRLYQIRGYKSHPYEPIIQELNGDGEKMGDVFPVALSWFDTQETGRVITWLKKEGWATHG